MSENRYTQRLHSTLIKMMVEGRETRRMMQNLERSGKVTKHGEDPRLIKVDIGPEGQVVETPWIQWREKSGAIKTYARPSIGEHVMVHSPGGEIGKASHVTLGGFTDENPEPDDRGDVYVIEVGDSRIEMTDSEINFIASKISTTGATHLDGGTRPVHYVGGADDMGDIAVDGASNVFV